jgi:hypothetical protein
MFHPGRLFAMSDNSHISDDELEAYYTGTVPESELARIVEHLVWCTGCLLRLDFTEDYIDAMRRATIIQGFDRVSH